MLETIRTAGSTQKLVMAGVALLAVAIGASGLMRGQASKPEPYADLISHANR